MAWPLKEPSDPPPSPMVVEPLRAFQVWGPTTPSTLMPAADCRLRTAVRVAGPKDPSTASEAPRSLSLVCRVRRSEEHTSELQSRGHLVCRLLLEKKNIHVHEVVKCR